MTFATMTPAIVALGAVAIAALLFALQRLRARRRVVAMAAAPLWAAAVRVAPPRVLIERFRRWGAYLLVVAIALCLWMAAARPKPRAAADGRQHLFYLDASALMLPGDRFAAARRALLHDAALVPAADRVVELGGADGPLGTRLLDAGEETQVLRGRLAKAAPASFPSGFGGWLAAALSGRDRMRPLTIHYYGPAIVAAAMPRPLPAGVDVVLGYGAAALSSNCGIVALGASPAVSGAWGTADVLVRLAALGAPVPGMDAVRFTLDGRPFTPTTMVAAGDGALVLRDVPAAGGTLRVALKTGDGFAADDTADLVLPDRRPVRVAVAPGIPAAIARLVAVDPALRAAAPGDAQVAVRAAGSSFAAGLPALVLADPARQAATFAITDPDARDGAAFAHDLGDTGVTGIDAGRLADETGRPVSVALATGPRRALSLWSDLFAANAGFARSRAMPLLVSQSLRWLARPSPWIPFAQAGTSLVDQSSLYGLAGDTAIGRLVPDGAVFVPAAGMQRLGGRTVAAALDSPALTRAAASPVAGAGGTRSGPALPDASTVLLVLAGLLLALEWHLLMRRAIP